MEWFHYLLKRQKKINIPQFKIKKRLVAFTGESFFPYLKQFIEKLQKKDIPIDLIPIKNNLFGESVTVTGLLAGEDIIKGLASNVEKDDIVLIPDVIMKDTDNRFLDDLTPSDIEKILQVKTVKIGTQPSDLLEFISTIT